MGQFWMQFNKHGWSVWWDQELVAGPSYELKIEEALVSAYDLKCRDTLHFTCGHQRRLSPSD